MRINTNIKHRDRKYVVISGVFLLVSILIGIFLSSQVSNINKALVEQDRELTGLVNELSIQQAAVGNSNSQTVQSVTGLDVTRKSDDDSKARAFLEKVMTWADYDAYQTMRTSVMAEYEIQDSSSFAKIFLPRYPLGLSGRAEGYSCRFTGMTSQVTNIRANEYNYFSTAKAIAASPEGGNRTITVVFLYTTDADGKLSNLQAYTI